MASIADSHDALEIPPLPLILMQGCKSGDEPVFIHILKGVVVIYTVSEVLLSEMPLIFLSVSRNLLPIGHMTVTNLKKPVDLPGTCQK